MREQEEREREKERESFRVLVFRRLTRTTQRAWVCGPGVQHCCFAQHELNINDYISHHRKPFHTPVNRRVLFCSPRTTPRALLALQSTPWLRLRCGCGVRPLLVATKNPFQCDTASTESLPGMTRNPNSSQVSRPFSATRGPRIRALSQGFADTILAQKPVRLMRGTIH
jgi:hypothetical protein